MLNHSPIILFYPLKKKSLSLILDIILYGYFLNCLHPNTPPQNVDLMRMETLSCSSLYFLPTMKTLGTCEFSIKCQTD